MAELIVRRLRRTLWSSDVDWNYLLWRFDGRIGRRTFWIAFLTVAAVEVMCHLTVLSLGMERLSATVSLAFGYPEFAILAKRGHDRNISTWVPGVFYAYSVFIDFVMVIGAAGTQNEPSPLLALLSLPWLVFAIALLIDFGFRRGTFGPNRFGPDPLRIRPVNRGNGAARD